MINVPEMLTPYEWYDNSALLIDDSCHRKFYWLREHGERGLENRVGPGAHFGSCMHAALASYYRARIEGSPEQARRIAAMRSFTAKYDKLFYDQGRVKPAHRLANGLEIVDGYFDHFNAEDEFLTAIELEVGFAILIYPEGKPAEGGSVEGESDSEPPFWYLGACDGVFARRSHGDVVVKESKTTGSGVDRELLRLQMDRQIEGYVWAMRQFAVRDMPKVQITGAMVDVILVASQKREFAREFYHVTERKTDAWLQETIEKVRGHNTTKADVLEKQLN